MKHAQEQQDMHRKFSQKNDMEEQEMRKLRLGESAIQVNFRDIKFENMNWNEPGMQTVREQSSFAKT
jgi:hypothetical protein